MKKKHLFTIVMSLFIVPALCFCFTAGASAKTITLTYSNFFPPTHIQSKLAAAWCKAVEKETHGRVKIQYYPGGTLTKAPQCYDGVVEGLSDIGFSVLAYSRGRFPVMGAVDLPFGYPSGIIATRVANDVYNKFKPKEFRDTHILYLHGHGPGIVWTKSRPVRTLADMKGLKLRGTGTSAKIIKALGGTPVGIPMPETYQAIQKGTVDGGVYPCESNKGWKLGEVVRYGTADFSAAYTTTFFVTMNKDKWNSLPTDIQKTIDKIDKEWIIKHGKAWDHSDLVGIKYFLSQGGELIGLNRKQSMKWKKAVRPIINNYIKVLNKKGLNGKKIVHFIERDLKKLEK